MHIIASTPGNLFLDKLLGVSMWRGFGALKGVEEGAPEKENGGVCRAIVSTRILLPFRSRRLGRTAYIPARVPDWP